MPNVLLTYDITETRETVCAELRRRLVTHYGFSSQITATDGNISSLPNTTLRKTNTTSEDAKEAFLVACKDVGATWEKYITTEFLKCDSGDQ
jgi:hypothetical protein